MLGLISCLLGTKLLVNRFDNDPRPMSIYVWHVVKPKGIGLGSFLDPCPSRLSMQLKPKAFGLVAC